MRGDGYDDIRDINIWEYNIHFMHKFIVKQMDAFQLLWPKRYEAKVKGVKFLEIKHTFTYTVGKE